MANLPSERQRRIVVRDAVVRIRTLAQPDSSLALRKTTHVNEPLTAPGNVTLP
jgi:hypothetical protein